MPPVKTCGCGQQFTFLEWKNLQLVGHQHVAEDEHGPALSIELRNCPCGSTIAIEE